MTSVILNNYNDNNDNNDNNVQYYVNINNAIKHTQKNLYCIGFILLFLVPYYNMSYVFYILPWLFIGSGLFLKSIVVIYKKYKEKKYKKTRDYLRYGKSYIIDS